MTAAARWQFKLATILADHWRRKQPSALARLLQPLSCLYAALLGLREQAYALGLVRIEQASVPVIVVGNLVAGGAGKTPMVMHLVALLRSQGFTPGVIARGYGASSAGAQIVNAQSAAQKVGDEPLLVHLRTRAPVAVGKRRIDAARLLCSAEPAIDILVADDGLQHRSLARTLDVIVFDERGLGNGLLLPAGPLRQGVPRMPPDRSVVFYNAARASTDWPGSCARRDLAGAAALADWWQGANPSLGTLHALRGCPLWAAAGLAVPERFFDMLRSHGLAVKELALPDHNDYAVLPWPREATDVIVTEKDAVKIRPERCAATRVWVAALDFVPDAAFDAAVLKALPPRPMPPP
jgi:tetraacyldisaccharide 4'-kinase